MTTPQVEEVQTALEDGEIDRLAAQGSSVVEPLVSLLGQGWCKAAIVLGRIGDERAVGALIGALVPWSDEELRTYRAGPDCRLAAARALTQLRDARALRPIAQLLRNRQLEPGWISATWIAEHLLGLLVELLEATAADASDEDLRYLAKLRKPRQLRCFSGEDEPRWVEELDFSPVKNLARSELARRSGALQK